MDASDRISLHYPDPVQFLEVPMNSSTVSPGSSICFAGTNFPGGAESLETQAGCASRTASDSSQVNDLVEMLAVYFDGIHSGNFRTTTPSFGKLWRKIIR